MKGDGGSRRFGNFENSLPSAITMSNCECQAVLVHGAGGGAWEWCLWERELAAAGVVPRAVELRPTAQGYEVRYGGRVVHVGFVCLIHIQSRGHILSIENTFYLAVVHVECVCLICCCESHGTCVRLCVCVHECVRTTVCVCVCIHVCMQGSKHARRMYTHAHIAQGDAMVTNPTPPLCSSARE